MFLLFNLVVLLLTGAVGWWAPGARRVNGGLVFQEGDPASVKEAVQRLLSEYRKQVLLALAAAVVAVLGLQWRLGDSHWVLIYTTFAVICGALTFGIQWRMRDLRIAHAQRREAYLVIDELEELPRWPWLAAMAMLALAALYLAAIWHAIPASFPVQWDFSTGNPNGWSERTIRFVPVWIAVGLSALGLWMPRGVAPNKIVFLAGAVAYLAGLLAIVNRCARQARGSR